MLTARDCQCKSFAIVVVFLSGDSEIEMCAVMIVEMCMVRLKNNVYFLRFSQCLGFPPTWMSATLKKKA